ncbi:hypothetical protein [Bacillus sp. X1(2014)]|uniref:hypothetical protein n=1 Tax=Bacillus sp. X1(2014) TaxID=1565991 RepID=UPI0011A7A137|nr:hypothetical protein [Bacillus sp. X1(2014)]
MNYLRWCGWNWLRSKGELNPIFNHLYVTLFSPSLKMFANAGDGEPYQIISHLLANRSNRFVHIPFRPIHKLYIFEATELLYLRMVHPKTANHLEGSSKIQLMLSPCLQQIDKILEYGKQLNGYVANQESLPKWGGLLPVHKGSERVSVKEAEAIQKERNITKPLLVSEKIQNQKKEKIASPKKKKNSLPKKSKQVALNLKSQQGWTVKKDQILITRVFEGLTNGMHLDEIFNSGIKEIGMDVGQCKSRWYNKWSKEYKQEVAKLKASNSDRENQNKWDSHKESILYSAILEGTREGRPLTVITAQVSKKIGISPSACQSYWYSHVPKEYKEEFKKIKLNQEKNWSREDLQLLNHLITVAYAHLSPYESLPIASERLKRHIDIVRRKWFELQRMKRMQG